MSDKSIESRFFGKTWIHRAGALIFGCLSTICLIVGPLFWLGVAARADGKPPQGEGPILTAFGVVFFPLFAVSLFNMAARQAPIMQFFREGIEVRVVGRLTIDRFAWMPWIVRVAWLMATLQGFRVERRFIPWSDLWSYRIEGPPLARSLVLVFMARPEGFPVDPGLCAQEFAAEAEEEEEETEGFSARSLAPKETLILSEAEFKIALERVYESITHHFFRSEVRGALPSWFSEM
jgi:hypothetical protein